MEKFEFQITDVSDVALNEMEDQKPKGLLKVTDVSGIDPYTTLAEQAQEATSLSNITQPTLPAAPNALVVGYLSYSQVETFTNCKRSYFERYHAKKRPKKHPAARLGTTVHKVLESVYRWALGNKYKGKFPIEQAFQCLKEVWADPKEGLAGEAHTWWADAVLMLRNYAQANPVIDATRVLGVEIGQEEEDHEGPTTFMLGGYPFVAKIDKVEKLDEETALISDYKSDRMIRYRDDVDRDLQLTIYEIAVRRRFPWVKYVVLELNMLRHGISQQARTRTPEELADAEMFVEEVGREIVAETTWEPKLNRWCHTCGYKADCSAYQDALKGGADEDSMLAQDLIQIGQSFNQLGEMRDEMEHRAKILTKRKDEIDAALKAHLNITPTNDLKTEHKEYYIGLTTRKEFPRLETIEIISRYTGTPQGFIDAEIATVEKTLMDKAIEKLKKGKTPKDVFKIGGYPGDDKPIDKGLLDLMTIELDSVAKLSQSTRIMSRNRKGPEQTFAQRKSSREEAAKTATIDSKQVEMAMGRSRTLEVIRGSAVDIPPPTEAEIAIETGDDVRRMWKFVEADPSKWDDVKEVDPDKAEFVEVDYIEPGVALALWNHVDDTTPKNVVKKPGVLNRVTSLESIPPKASSGTSAASASDDSGVTKRRKPLSEETRAKMSEAAKKRHAAKQQAQIDAAKND